MCDGHARDSMFTEGQLFLTIYGINMYRFRD